MTHVFLSYSHNDREYVKRLKQSLQNEGFEIWNDQDIEAGSRWFKEITSAIKRSSAVIVVMTTLGEESEWVEKEILYAIDCKKQIFPLLLEGQVFALLINQQFEDVRGKKLPAEGFYNQLAKSTPRKKTQQSFNERQLNIDRTTLEYVTHTEGHAFIGNTEFDGIDIPISIPNNDRQRHTLIVGNAGSGKTALLQNLAIQDINHWC
jgi:KaiC/GvpD/RAD55 family RecA-like ATPase